MNHEKFIKKLKAVEGVSLMELIVSLAVFTVLILLVTQIFTMVVDGQRNAINAQNIEENMRYALEKISKEIRAARVSNQDCDAAAVNKIFNLDATGAELYFKDKNSQCLTYYLENNRLKVTVGVGAGAVSDFITPVRVKVSNLKFYAADNLIGAFNEVQPYVTMVMDVKASGPAVTEQKMKIQMTVSSRHYE